MHPLKAVFGSYAHSGWNIPSFKSSFAGLFTLIFGKLVQNLSPHWFLFFHQFFCVIGTFVRLSQIEGWLKVGVPRIFHHLPLCVSYWTFESQHCPPRQMQSTLDSRRRHTCRWKYWFGVSGGRTCRTWALWKIYRKNSIRNLLLVLQVRNIFYQFRPQAPRSCRGPGIKFWYRQIFSKQYAGLLPESSVVNCQISVSLDGQTFTFYGLKYTLASCFVTCIVHNVIQRRCESSLYDRVGRSS